MSGRASARWRRTRASARGSASLLVPTTQGSDRHRAAGLRPRARRTGIRPTARARAPRLLRRGRPAGAPRRPRSASRLAHGLSGAPRGQCLDSACRTRPAVRRSPAAARAARSAPLSASVMVSTPGSRVANRSLYASPPRRKRYSLMPSTTASRTETKPGGRWLSAQLEEPQMQASHLRGRSGRNRAGTGSGPRLGPRSRPPSVARGAGREGRSPRRADRDRPQAGSGDRGRVRACAPGSESAS
jgi:hypothetical protein